MSTNHEWIYEYDNLTINSNHYYFRCVWCFDKKCPNEDNPSMQLVFNIWNDTKKEWVDIKEFKGSYLAEKLTDYIKNTINGQRAVYWDNNIQRDFNK